MTTHMVEHQPMLGPGQQLTGPCPDWRVQSDGVVDGRASFTVRCYHESTATRVAQALDLLDGFEERGTVKVERGGAVTVRPDSPIPEAEIMQRAREAVAAEGFPPVSIRRGLFDSDITVKAAARALRDLSKPLSEIVPKPVAPDLIEARKIAADALRNCEMPTMIASIERGDEDQAEIVKATLAAIKRGREMGLGELFTDEGVKKVQRALRE